MTTDFSTSGKQMQAPSLGDAAYVELKDRLSRGVFHPGDKLTVRSVAEALGVSSTPARDAINRLVGDNALVYAGPKTVIIPVLTEADLREITHIRLALEGLAAELAAEAASEQVIENLKEIQRKIGEALDRKAYAEALSCNKEFHFLVYRLSRMPHLVAMIEAQWLRVGPSFYGLYPRFAEERQGVRNHQMAIEALIEKDRGALRGAFENDIREGYRQLRSAIRDRTPRL